MNNLSKREQEEIQKLLNLKMDKLKDLDLLLDDFGSSDPKDYMAGFPLHPHRGIETITYILNGEGEHGVSIGNRGIIHQVMFSG